MNDNQKWEIIQGDALKVLSGFAPNTFDTVITDPPYASGGRTQSEKNKSTARKYSSMGENAVKSNMVYTLCKHMVYIFSLGSSTKRQLRFMV